MNRKKKSDDCFALISLVVIALIVAAVACVWSALSKLPKDGFVKPVCVPGSDCCPAKPIAPKVDPCPDPCPCKILKRKKPVAPPVAPEQPAKPVVPVQPAKPEIKEPPVVKCTVLMFTAKWCGPCQAAKPKIHEAMARGLDVRLIDIDAEPALAGRYGVTSVPDFLIYSDGKNFTRRTHDPGEVSRLIN